MCEALRLLVYIHISWSWRRGGNKSAKSGNRTHNFSWEASRKAFCCSIRQIPVSVRDGKRLVHAMFYSQNNFLLEKLYGMGMNVQHCWDVVLRFVSGLILDRLSESIVVINTTRDLRTCMQYVNETCNLNSYVEQEGLSLLWIALSNCQFQGWPNNKVQNKSETIILVFS